MSAHTQFYRQYFAIGGTLELWSRGQVADHLGVRSSNLHATCKGLPPPVARPGGRPVWFARDIEQFATERGGA